MRCSVLTGLRRARGWPLPRPRVGVELQRSGTRSRWVVVEARREFSDGVLSTLLMPPAVFGGLLITLWTYKCVMMVVFQNKIIYMPSVPPFSRREKVEDYTGQCGKVEWKEHEIKSVDGTAIKLLEGGLRDSRSREGMRHVVVLYFQGNASSLPPRLPYLSRILEAAATTNDSSKPNDARYTLIALSYRGFWTSSGSPTQPGIELDAEAALIWVLNRYSDPNTRIILWGQSIGAGAASVSLANLAKSVDGPTKLSRISGLLLETPFIDLRAMLIALYPQRFLPYRYLAPFLRSTWDSKTALSVVGDLKPKLNVLMLQAGDDELVPADNGPFLEQLCRDRGMQVERVVVKGALHTEVMAKPQGRMLISSFIKSFGKQ